MAATLRYVAEHAAETGSQIWASRHQFENDAGDTFDFDEAFFLRLANVLECIAAGNRVEPERLRLCQEVDEGEDEPDVAAQEPPKPFTPEQKAAVCRDMIEYFRTQLIEAEAQIAVASVGAAA